MSFHDLSFDNDSIVREDQLESCHYLNIRPFRGAGDSSSEDLIESEIQENPFKESQTGSIKDTSVVFKTKNATSRIGSWSEKMHKLTRSTKIVRSAPTPKNGLWAEYDNGERHTLPVIGQGKSDSIKRISTETVINLINGTISRKFSIIDARFKYEYDGGHIINAKNITEDEQIIELLREPQILIFHCEYSSVRGPALAQKVRDIDRKMNVYPNLKIPEMYVMEGGYKEFYTYYPEYCIPRSYVTMHDKNYAVECSLEHKKKKNKVNKF